MKKVYQEPQQKHYRQIRQEYELKQRRNKRRSKKGPQRRQRPTPKSKNDYEFLKVPANFSMSDIDATQEVIAFFGNVDRQARKRPVFLDFSNVLVIEPSAILYLVYFLEKHKDTSYFSGNAPSEPRARTIFDESGFRKYVHSGGNRSLLSKDSSKIDILKIKDSNLVDPEAANEMVKFAIRNLGESSGKELRNIYCTLIECMSNTANHAYKDQSKSSSHNKWYSMSLATDSPGKAIQFTFLDAGLGIPTTARTNFAEKIAKLVGNQDDAGIIYSALKGVFRTRTGERFRGKGLPKIKSYNDNGSIENLIIISNEGFVSLNNEEVRPLSLPFKGTLLSWKYTLKEENQ